MGPAITIHSVLNADNNGNPETIFFTVHAAANLGDYLIYDATFSDEDEVSNRGRHVYRFPTHAVKAGEEITLAIAKGPRRGLTSFIKVGGKQVPSHGFFWNRTAPIINNTGDTLTLVKVEAKSEHVFNVPAKSK